LWLIKNQAVKGAFVIEGRKSRKKKRNEKGTVNTAFTAV
jgi:hypothetical protein